MGSDSKILVTICARKGSRGVPLKNIRPLLGIPLLAHTIKQALAWPRKSRVIVSTDSEEISKVALDYGAEVPFIRPGHLATDTVAKMPILIHALEECEKHFNENYDVVLDLDPTSPVRTLADIEQGWETFIQSNKPVCFSAVRARKNPYFNMIEKSANGSAKLVRKLDKNVTSRQTAPPVWEMNASIYFYSSAFLRSNPVSLWEGDPAFFEMPAESAFDIDEERDFVITELMMKRLSSQGEFDG